MSVLFFASMVGERGAVGAVTILQYKKGISNRKMRNGEKNVEIFGLDIIWRGRYNKCCRFS